MPTAAKDVLRIERPPKTLRELTTDRLRQAILTLHFKPGEHLVERDLCAQMGVSRTSVREALRHLEAEGLIERSTGRGLTVASVSPDEARQIYEIRAAIEPAMALLFTERASDRDLEELRLACQRIEKTSHGRRASDNAQAFEAFYTVIMRGARNDTARRMLQGLHGRMSYLRAVTSMQATDAYREETVTLVQEITNAGLGRDGTLMAERCRAFVKRSERFARKVLAGETVPA